MLVCREDSTVEILHHAEYQEIEAHISDQIITSISEINPSCSLKRRCFRDRHEFGTKE